MLTASLASKPLAPCSQRRSRAASSRQARLAVRASAQQQPKPLQSVDDSNINPYCSIDEQGQRKAPMTLGEKEQAFLEALSAFYYEGRSAMPDEEFDLLKDELVWSGSKVAVLSSNELKFLEARFAANRGQPVMSDAEFDALKLQLKRDNSIVTAEGPRCNLETRKVSSTASVDYVKLVALNIPAAVTVLAGVFSIDDLTGFEVTKIIELPGPLGIVALWGFLLPTVYVLASSLTNLVFKDALILKAPCPSCGTENTVYFGDILTIAGNRKKSAQTCPNCKAQLEWDADMREVVQLEEGKA